MRAHVVGTRVAAGGTACHRRLDCCTRHTLGPRESCVAVSDGRRVFVVRLPVWCVDVVTCLDSVCLSLSVVSIYEKMNV